MDDLEKKLKKIRKVFIDSEILSINPDLESVKKYYKVNQLAYSLLHTLSDRIYMGVSRDGKYRAEDLLEAAKTVQKYIEQSNAVKVLELATGRGANSYWLAKRNPNVSFQGVDISDGQLYFARKKSSKLNNYFPKSGDYHDLSSFEENSFDVCFVVEALCYSTDKGKVLSEVSRVLKEGGIMVIFDGYLGVKRNDLSRDGEIVAKMTEVGMAVTEFEGYSSFFEKISKSPFSVVHEEDVSTYVLPTMRRFERLAKAYYKFPIVAKVLKRLLPSEFIYNSLSGYLMPTLIEKGIAKYMITVLRNSTK